MRKIAILSVTAILAVSCNNDLSNRQSTISIDITKNNTIHIDNCELTKFNGSNNPVIFESIKQISFVDSDIIVQARNHLAKYNAGSGEHIVDYSEMGRANNEYVTLWNHWIDKDGNINIYDMNGKKILVYSNDGDYINSIALSTDANSSPFQSLASYKDLYIGKRIYDGLNNTPELALYNSDYKFVKSICNFKMKSGINFGNQFYSYNDILLYNRYFENTIYEIEETGEKERWSIDFGDKTVKNIDSYEDEYEIIDYINSLAHDNFCTMISNIYESNRYLSFVFLHNGDKFLAVYNKRTGTIKTFNFDSTDVILTYIEVYNDEVYIFFEDDVNTYLKSIKFSELKKFLHEKD